MSASFDIDALRAALIGTELQSFASAAVQLGRSQSAISMQLKKLEQQAGAKLFVRKGRGLVPTEEGEAFLDYARRIVALNDEAAVMLGAKVNTATVRLGLPQDFFDEVMPATLRAFTQDRPDVHVEAHAGPNHVLSEQVAAGRLDVAVALFRQGAASEGEILCELPMRWISRKGGEDIANQDPLPLVLFNHPCHFRQAALGALEKAQKRWRATITTPSLPGIWSSVRSKFGIAVRTEHGMPDDMACLGPEAGLPDLPNIQIRMLLNPNRSALANSLGEILKRETIARIAV